MIIAIVLLSSIAFGLVIPELPALFSSSPSPFHFDTSFQAMQWFTAMLILFAVANFFGSSFFGSLSDRLGRKKTLSISLYGFSFGYLVTGWAIFSQQLFLLLLGEVIAGFTAAYIPIAYAITADSSHSTKKTQQFGLLALSISLGIYVLGSLGNVSMRFFLGKTLSVSLLTASFFFLSSVLLLLAAITATFFLQETHPVAKNAPLSCLRHLHQFRRAWIVPRLPQLCLLIFLIHLGLQTTMKFLQFILSQHFHLSQMAIRFAYIHHGVWMAIAQYALLPFLIKRCSCKEGMKWTMLLWGGTFGCLMLTQNRVHLFFFLACIAVGEEILRPFLASFVDQHVDRADRGQWFGYVQSIQSIVKIVAIPLADVLHTMGKLQPLFSACIFIFTFCLLKWSPFFSRQRA